METFFLVMGYDPNGVPRGLQHWFRPTPSLFKTEEEAQRFCSTASGGVIYTYEPVTLGHYDRRDLKKKRA